MSGCLNSKRKSQIFLNKYFKVRNKLLVNDGNYKFKERNTIIWNAIIPRLCLDSFHVSRELDTTLETLVKVRKLKIPFLKMLETGIISYTMNRPNIKDLIKQFMNDKNVTKAYIRFGHGNNPSFMVDLDKSESLNIDFDKYTETKMTLSSIIVHPIKSEQNYMKGVISMIFIDGKYSHSIIKKPTDMNVGIRKYKVAKFSPNYSLLRIGKLVVQSMNIGKRFPIIQINLCHNSDPVHQYLLTKVNYIDPKLYLEINKRHVKKIRKQLMMRCQEFNTITKNYSIDDIY